MAQFSIFSISIALTLPTDMAEASGFGHLDKLTNPDPDSHVENVPPTKRRKLYGLYVRIREFNTLDSAKDHVKAEGTYRFKVRRETSQGVKYFYNCIASANCSFKAYIYPYRVLWPNLFEHMLRLNSLFSFFTSSQQVQAAHDHVGQKRTIGITGLTKDAVGELYEQGITKSSP